MKQKYVMPDGEIIEREAVPVWKTPYNHDTNFETDRYASYTDEPSLTKQEFKQESDINFLMERFLRTGEPPPMALPEHFMDTERVDHFEMQCQVAETNALFYELPARIRSEFLNEPGRWADAAVTLATAGDVEGLRKIGIDATRKPQDGATSTPATPVAATPVAAPAAPESATPTGAPNVTPG